MASSTGPTSTTEPSTGDPARFRVEVVAASIELFAEHGYESTTVGQVAAAAGISRRTFFRQFGAKEDVIFADHEELFSRVAEHLDLVDDDPWSAPCAAAEIVFTHFLRTRDLAVRRFRIVQEVPALRDRELVMTYRYQRIFEEHLRARLPEASPAHLAGYAAAVTGTHNYLLRAMIRGDRTATLDKLRGELRRVRDTLGGDRPASSATAGAPHIVVITFPAGSDPDEVAAQVREQLRSSRGTMETYDD